VDIRVGDEVFAGSINQVGAVEVRAERVGTDSSYSRIIAAVEEFAVLRAARAAAG